MASTKQGASVAMEDSWRAESDQRTLMQACEILADKARINGVIKVQAKQRKAVSHMNELLASHKRNGGMMRKMKGMGY